MKFRLGLFKIINGTYNENRKKMIHFEEKKITLFNVAYVCIFLLFRSLNKREKRERNVFKLE